MVTMSRAQALDIGRGRLIPMVDWKTWHWDGLGWSMFGPLGGLLHRAMGDDAEAGFDEELKEDAFYPQTRAGDFGLALMALLPAVIRADQQISEPELDFVHYFFVTTFGMEQAQDLMALLENFLALDYSLKGVCSQIGQLMDHPDRLEMIHLLFGLAQADLHVAPEEAEVIRDISSDIGLAQEEFDSIRAMFVEEEHSADTILDLPLDANKQQADEAYRVMMDKHSPDKVIHLGETFQQLAAKKLRAIEQAYEQIRKERGWS
jgi:DnaJ like chaperone protein